MDEALRNRLAEKQGDDGASKFPRYIVPIINFNGNTGEYRLTPVDEFGDLAKEPVPVKSPVGIVILKKRSALASKLDDDISYFSSEFSSPTDTIALFQNLDGRVSFAEAGKVTDIRAKYPTIKTKSVLYCLYEGVVHKLEVKGASLPNFFEWQQEMKDEGKHSFEVTTLLGSDKQKHATLKKTYHVMTFKSEELKDFDGIEEAMDEVNEAIKKQDEYQAQRNVIAPTEQVVPESSTDSQEPNPDDIPF